jgi:predicted phage terminase large subunit-like protein
MAAELDRTIIRTPALNLIDRKLVELADHRAGRLAVFVSPQEGKSTTCSYWNPLWLLVGNPDLRIIILSYSDEMARRWGADIKAAVESFNGDEGTVDLGLRLRPDSRAAGRWQVDGHRGGVYCAGVGGSITGKPAEYILVDDPLKGLEEARSANHREKVMRTWRGSIVPRMAPTTNVIWVQTLWHEAEPIQEILATEGDDWDVVRIPAIADSPDDPLGRKIGEPMASARGARDWKRIRRDVGEYVFAALYQQRPAPAEGGLFRRLWWRFWTPAPQAGMSSPRLDLGGRAILLGDCWRFATVDLANSTRTSADWTAVGAWALTPDGDQVLLGMARAKVGEAHHFDLVRPLVQRWQLDTVFVEGSQYETTLVKDATREGVPISPLQAETDKFSRALPYSARCSAGRVWLPAGATWLEDWIGEHASFPNGSHDDLVDVGSMGTRVSITKWSPAVPAQLPTSTAADGPNFLTMPL